MPIKEAVCLQQQEHSIPGDAFTKEEIEDTLDPLCSQFNPSREYARFDIAALIPGPLAVTFMGRIVNFNISHGRSKSHAAAKGWHRMIVKDDTGAISVNLYFVNKPYSLKLGLLITIWTPYVGFMDTHNEYTIPNAPNTTSIFPGRDASVHMIIHNSDVGDAYRTPLEYRKGHPLPGLLTLRSFIAGGNEILGSKILVCVKSIGARKPIVNKQGVTSDLTEVAVFDDTADSILKLWMDMGLSTKDWNPSKTILLISDPGFILKYGKCGNIFRTASTMIEVEPEFPEAEWLRKYARSLNKQESMDQTFPNEIWDLDTAINGPERALFTIADVDDFVRTDPGRKFMGFLSVTVMELGLVTQFRRQTCINCEKEVKLRLNPKIIGTLLDESGSIAHGKLLWSDNAWEDLFGRPVDEFLASESKTIKLMEQRLSFMRLTLVFGWAEEVGKLAILAVMM